VARLETIINVLTIVKYLAMRHKKKDAAHQGHYASRTLRILDVTLWCQACNSAILDSSRQHYLSVSGTQNQIAELQAWHQVGAIKLQNRRPGTRRV